MLILITWVNSLLVGPVLNSSINKKKGSIDHFRDFKVASEAFINHQ